MFSKSILIFEEEDFEDKGDDEEAIFVLMIRILFWFSDDLNEDIFSYTDLI